MKVILRNTETDLYFIGPNMWTNDPERAHDFGYAERAAKQARAEHLKDMELIMSVSGFQKALRLPVTDFYPGS